MHNADDIYWLIVIAVAGIVALVTIMGPLTEWYTRWKVGREAKLRDGACPRR